MTSFITRMNQAISTLSAHLAAQRTSNPRYGRNGRSHVHLDALSAALPAGADVGAVRQLAALLDLDEPGLGHHITVTVIGGETILSTTASGYLLLAIRTGLFLPAGETTQRGPTLEEPMGWTCTATGWSLFHGQPVTVSQTVTYHDAYERMADGTTPTRQWISHPQSLLAQVARCALARTTVGPLLAQVPCVALGMGIVRDATFSKEWNNAQEICAPDYWQLIARQTGGTSGSF